VEFSLLIAPLNASALLGEGEEGGAAAAAYGLGLRGAFAALLPVRAAALDYVLLVGSLTGEGSAAFDERSAVNSAGNAFASADDAMGALGVPVPPASGRRRARMMALALQGGEPPAGPPPPGAAALQFNVVLPSAGAAADARGRLLALSEEDYAAVGAALSEATAGLPDAPRSFSLNVTRAALVTVRFSRWALLAEWLRRNVVTVAAWSGALMLVALLGAALRGRVMMRRNGARVAARGKRERGREEGRGGARGGARGEPQIRGARLRAVAGLLRWARGVRRRALAAESAPRPPAMPISAQQVAPPPPAMIVGGGAFVRRKPAVGRGAGGGLRPLGPQPGKPAAHPPHMDLSRAAASAAVGARAAADRSLARAAAAVAARGVGGGGGGGGGGGAARAAGRI
jgi:hypothetical protein